jgi:hypothetical protein
LIIKDNAQYMATFNKFNAFVENIAEGVHNLQTGALTIALTNTAPTAANSILTDITQIAYTNLSSRVITVSASAQSAGTYKLTLADLTLTTTGGATGPFRYVVIYNDTPTSPADPLVGWYDYGSSITLADGESIVIDFDGTNGVLTIA